MTVKKPDLRFFWALAYPAFLVLAFYPPRLDGYLNPYDEGLWLGIAQAILDGKAVYRDVFFHYGWLLAEYVKATLTLLPATLASLRGAFWLLNTVSLLVIYAALLRWVKNAYLRLAFGAIVFCVPLAAHVATIPMAGRYAAGFLSLLFWPGLNDPGSDERRRGIGAGLATGLALFISQEVGLAVLAGNVFVFSASRRRLTAFLLGLGAVITPLFLWLAATNTLKPYLDCTLLQTSVIVFNDHLPIPHLAIRRDIPWFISWQIVADSLALYIPAFFYGIGVLSFTLAKVRHAKDARLLAGLLLYGTLASIIAWVRPDRWHIYSALSPALFLWAVAADGVVSAKKDRFILAAIALGAFLTFPHAKLRVFKDRHYNSYARRTSMTRMGSSRLPPAQADGYEYLIEWVHGHVSPGASFLFFPYDGCIYFLTGRPNPTFYPVLMLANTPAMLARGVHDLAAAPPEWVIWDTANNAFDGKRIDELLRPICEFIAAHYVVKEKRDTFIFLHREEKA